MTSDTLRVLLDVRRDLSPQLRVYLQRQLERCLAKGW